MKIIGITGRSGCGKSSATKFLAAQGYPCIDADLIAREVLLPGSPCLPPLQAYFGADIVDEEGQLRRRLDAQTPVETLRAAARWELVNDGTEAQLQDKVSCLLRQLREGGL